MTKLIYIGGYGHSGSTLLEYLMAGSPAVLACGEVVSVIRERDSDRKKKVCSCGRGAEACPVWGFYHSGDGRSLSHAELLHAIMDNADGKYAALVDSSKTAWGSFGAPFQLRWRFGSHFVLVHLLRQPAGACWSVLRKKNRTARKKGQKLHHYSLRCAWTVFSWSAANLSCELFGLLYKRQYYRLRYEDLVRAPEETLRALFDKVSPGDWIFTHARLCGNRHQLYGNSVKHRQLAITDVKEDLKWQAEMPPEYSRVVLALSYPLRLRYGY